MSFNFSQIRETLSRVGGGASHRHVFILAGGERWQQEALNEILFGYASDSLWLGEYAVDDFPFVATKKAHSWLGNEKKVVVFDANQDFDPDSFAAISGIVVGGGLFFLLLPSVEQWNAVYASRFGQRLITSIHRTPELIVIRENDDTIEALPYKSHTNTPTNLTAPFLTSDQQSVVETIEVEVLSDTNNPVVVISDRGRGKSAALGLAAARLLKAGIKNIAITAPRLRATDIIFKHIAKSLPEATVTRGCVKLGDSSIQFYAPDKLLKGGIDAEVLLIDEAAAIPVPLLSSYLDNFIQCVFATTVHGYEGTGRGFALRFNKILNEKYPAWLKLQMETPIRWAAYDPLENWMFSLLCLDADIVNVRSINENEINQLDPDKLEQRLLDKAQLENNPILLNETFALLVFAHYRTRPSDLKNLLDDDDISLYITLYKEHVVAVALVIREGRFSASLSSDVYRGERRPAGNLLAQALTYHCGVEHAATLDYARIMRIAVHPELQQQGIGSALIDYIVAKEKQHGRDAIGTSFGMNTELLSFWKRSKFNVVRIGFTREQTSGEHAAIMLMPLTENGSEVYKEACARFNQQFPFWFADVLKDIPSQIKNNFNSKVIESLELNEYDKKDLDSFVKYSRNYELCIAALNKFVVMNECHIQHETFNDNCRKVLNNKVIKKLSWKEIARKMNLIGQNEARKLFHNAICYVMIQNTEE